MKIYDETSLRYFGWWSGAKSNAETLTMEQLDELESTLEELYPDGIDATELNDIMWFEFDTVREWLGIESEEEDTDNG